MHINAIAMKRYCSQCGKIKLCDLAGHCKPCAKKLEIRRAALRAEGFYNNMDKLRQPRYFNFTREP